jgi:autotransporter-associated beta strand protein
MPNSSGLAQAGTFTVTPSAAVFGVGSASNYRLSYVPSNYTVTPVSLNLAIAKTYDATDSFSAANTYTLTGMVNGETAPTIFSGTATVSGTDAGTYNSFVSKSFVLSDGNYTLSGGNVAATVNQRPSVTFIGASGDNWSTVANWTDGAIPTKSNVATVVIPAAITVVYDHANLTSQAPTSAISNEGSLSVVSDSALTLSGAISGVGGLAKSGSGTLTLSGASSYQGSTSVSAGTLRVSGNLSNATALRVASSANFQAASTSAVGSIEGAGILELGGGVTFSVGANNASTSFSGLVTGPGRLAKIGMGQLTLTGNNDFSGGTTVGEGSLLAGTSTAFGSGVVTVSGGGATVDLNGYSVGNNFSLNGFGIAGAGGNLGALTNSANTAVTLSGAMALNSSAAVGGSGDLMVIGGVNAIVRSRCQNFWKQYQHIEHHCNRCFYRSFEHGQQLRVNCRIRHRWHDKLQRCLFYWRTVYQHHGWQFESSQQRFHFRR